MSDQNGTAPVTDAATTAQAAPAAVGNVLADAPATTAAAGDQSSKPADQNPDAKPADGEGAKEGDKPDGAPEQYEDFKLPEGYALDEAKVTDFKDFAKANNLTQEAAQGLVDRHVAALEEANKAPYTLWHDTQKQWQEAAKADPEFGGAQYEANIAKAASAIDQFGGPKLREALNFTGAGNNPEVIRAFVRIGQAMGEGKFVSGNPASTAPKSTAEILFGDTAPKN